MKIYDAVAVKDAFYKSGRPVFSEGDRLRLEVKDGTDTVYVTPASNPHGNEFVYSTDDEDWVWEHLLVELPWKDFGPGGKEVQSNGQGN